MTLTPGSPHHGMSPAAYRTPPCRQTLCAKPWLPCGQHGAASTASSTAPAAGTSVVALVITAVTVVHRRDACHR